MSTNWHHKWKSSESLIISGLVARNPGKTVPNSDEDLVAVIVRDMEK